MKNQILGALFLFAALLPAQNTPLQTQFDQLLQAQFPADGPGAAVLITRKGEVLYKKAIGKASIELDVPLSTDNVFRIGSVTKQFTAAAILRLAEEGKLSLQDEITTFIPDYPTQGKKITVEHLLNHTSGIKSYTEMVEWNAMTRRKDFSPRELVDFFKNERMDFEPGTKYKYNNSGFILLGFIIEKVSGKSYAAYLDEQFFKPLGMQHTYYDSSERLIKNRANGYSEDETTKGYTNAEFLSTTQPYSAGALTSTVEDLTTWTRAVHSGKVLKPESMQKAFKANILPDGTNTYYGYGWQIGALMGSHTIEHGGAINGFLSYLIYVKEEDVCVAVLTNCDCVSPDALGDKLAALAAGKDLAPKAISVNADVLSGYTGVYENEKKEQRVITVENGVLKSQRSGGPKFTLTPYAPGQFYFENSLSRLRFAEEGKGAKKTFKAIVSDRHSDENMWVKTDKPLPVGKPEVQLTAAQLEPFLGEYQLAPGFTMTVTREGTQLFCQATGQSRFEVYAESPTRFFLKVVDATIEFYPDATGKVPQMTLFQGGQEIPGKRVK
jgi:CubicO group peptidase (beta-lactamase class C family)